MSLERLKKEPIPFKAIAAMIDDDMEQICALLPEEHRKNLINALTSLQAGNRSRFEGLDYAILGQTLQRYGVEAFIDLVWDYFFEHETQSVHELSAANNNGLGDFVSMSENERMRVRAALSVAVRAYDTTDITLANLRAQFALQEVAGFTSQVWLYLREKSETDS